MHNTLTYVTHYDTMKMKLIDFDNQKYLLLVKVPATRRVGYTVNKETSE